jgi:hypothetical protein
MYGYINYVHYMMLVCMYVTLCNLFFCLNFNGFITSYFNSHFIINFVTNIFILIICNLWSLIIPYGMGVLFIYTNVFIILCILHVCTRETQINK